jgi:hypothetical protein
MRNIIDNADLGGPLRTMYECRKLTAIYSISADALHLAHLVASHGYVFQIDDHVLTGKI